MRRFKRDMRGPIGGMPKWGVERAVFASKCILKKWNMRKVLYIPGLEITRFALEFRGFLAKIGLRVQQLPLKVIVITYETFKVNL